MTHRLRTLAVCAALTAITLFVYSPVAGYPFLRWDDHFHVTENDHVRTGLTWDNFVWSLGIHGPSQWHPLAWWSHQLDSHWFGADAESSSAGWHHVTNVVLHVAAALAILAALARLTGAFWRSALVAALFALHPLSVESVAWISERRDVLSTLLWGLTMWAYAAYAQRGGAARYLLMIACFVLGLMAKPMLITLPFALLLLDYWPLGRLNPGGWRLEEGGARSAAWGKLIVEKLPLFVLAAVSAWLSYLCQVSEGTIQSLASAPLSLRLANVAVNYVLYLRNLVWPWNLSPVYPPLDDFSPRLVFAAVMALVLVTAAVFPLRRRCPYLLIGWLWYLGTLLPVSGLLRMGVDVSMADRWVYVPMLGIYIAAAWGLGDLLGGWRGGRIAAVGLAIVLLAACAGVSRRQVEFWSGTLTLFGRAIAVDPTNAQAHFQLGTTLHDLGRTDDAMAEYRTAIRLRPRFADAHNSLGTIYQGQRDNAAAIAEFQAALDIDPDFSRSRFNLGNTLRSQNNIPEATEQFRHVVRLSPRLPEGHYILGTLLGESGDYPKAAEQFQEALRLRPNYPEAENDLGAALKSRGDLNEAVEHFQTAVRLKPDLAAAQHNLGSTLALLGRLDEAIDPLKQAVRLQPNDASTRNNLGVVLAQQGRIEEAIAQFREALAINPRDPQAEKNLDELLKRAPGKPP